MADVTMKALDTFHASNVRADNLQAGDVFTINETDAKRLEAAGLAERGGTTKDAVNVAVESDRAESREEIDAERGGTKAITGAPQNKAEAKAPLSAATAPAKAKRK